jgi:hypothetical protein
MVLLALFAGVFVFYACNKNETASENVITKTTTLDYVNIVNSLALSTEEEITSGDDSGLKSAEIIDCLTVTVHENDNGDFWPRSWTLDYGSENCACYFGNLKRGKINVTLSDWWRNEGSLREITFEDYFFNDNQLEGTKTILNTGVNESGNLTFTKNVNDAKLTYTDGSSITWNCEKYSELIEGGDTFVFADDVWSVTGSGSGVDLDGKAYTMEITTPLIYQNGCFYPVSGIVEIVTDGQDIKVIDYGSGECDNIIAVTEGGVTENIEI